MASFSLAIHIPIESNPETISNLVEVLANDPDVGFSKIVELTLYLERHGIGSRGEISTTAITMGILSRQQDTIRLTNTGFALARIRKDVLADVLHLLMYSGWSPVTPMEFLQSWSYRLCCQRYWMQGQVELTSEYLNRQVSEVVAFAPTQFAGLDELSSVSFGRKSLRGALNWLSALTPSVIEGQTFHRRTYCPPELLMLALGYVLREEQTVTDVDILLTRDKREAICQACLLEPEMLDRTLDWAISIFPNLIEPGTTAGFYGRFVRLRKLPSIEDVIR